MRPKVKTRSLSHANISCLQLPMSQNDNPPFIERRLLAPVKGKSTKSRFRIYYADLIGPERTVGEPGDLWITQHPPSAYYKAVREDGQERDKWRLATFRNVNQADIIHPEFRNLVLASSSSGPTWRSIKSSLSFASLEESIMIFFRQQGTLKALPGSSSSPIEI
jgi:hypothetical protein